MTSVPKFPDPFARTLWVQSQLRYAGKSFASIARSMTPKVNRNAVRQAMFHPSARIERAIAKAIGLEPKELFPERYDAQGNRRFRVTEPHSQENTHGKPGGNDDSRQAA